MGLAVIIALGISCRKSSTPASRQTEAVYPTLEEAAVAAWEFETDLPKGSRWPGKDKFDRAATLKLLKLKAEKIKVDLNGDRVDEVLIANGIFVDKAGKETSDYGAQNRSWAVLQKVIGGWRVVGSGWGSPCPPQVLAKTTNGWKDLESGYHLSAGSGSSHLYQFDGKRYTRTKQTHYGYRKTQPAYPEDDSWGKGDVRVVPSEFVDGTATLEQAKAWVRAGIVGSCLGNGAVIDVDERELVPGGEKATFISDPSGRGTGGNNYTIFAHSPRGLRYLGGLFGGGCRSVPPDSQGRPRLVNYHRSGGGEGNAYLVVLTEKGFVNVARVDASGDDGATEEKKRVFETLFGKKPVSEETLVAIFGKAALQAGSATRPATQPVERKILHHLP